MIGRPVSFHAMRGISRRSNGFHLPRAASAADAAGCVDTPGPLPAAIPRLRRQTDRVASVARRVVSTPHRWVSCGPEDLLVDADGKPTRIDHAVTAGPIR